MKVYLLNKTGVISYDQFANEWKSEHENMVEVLKTSKEKVFKENEFEISNSAKTADIIWIFSEKRWRMIDPITLSRKKVIVTISNIVPDKFGKAAKKEFKQMDQFVDAYHAPCELTRQQLEKHTNKPIFCHPFWVNQAIWFPKYKYELRKKYNIESEAFIVGNFQSDTENDLVSPKMEKGPDVFCDLVIALHKIEPMVQVLLSGKKRNYVMKRLYDAGVTHHYKEDLDNNALNDFYNMIDLYIVGSRYEAGPQSIFECAATRTPIISTSVGYAPELLNEKCMIENGATWRDASSDEVLDYNFHAVQELFIPYGFKKFEEMIRKVSNGCN